MLSNRLLVLLGGCLLAASAACADDLGYVDCASHADATPVFAKARKSQDIVANVACGERFKVLLYGFIFSEIQTADGKVGFIYSNVMTVDRSGGSLQMRAASGTTPALSSASEKTKVYAEPTQMSAPAQPKHIAAPMTPAAAVPASASDTTANTGGANSVAAQPAATPEPAPSPATTATVNPASAASAPAAPDVRGASAEGQTQPAAAPAQPAAAPPTFADGATVLKATTGSSGFDAAPVNSAAPAQAESAVNAAPAAPSAAAPNAAPATTTTPAPAAASAETTSAAPDTAAPGTETAANTNTAETAAAAPAPTPAPATAPQPAPAAVPQPQPAAAEPEPPIIRNEKVRTESWEKPNPGARAPSLLELFGGFAFGRMNSGGGYGNGNNFLGGMGSFGFNVKPWIQIVGDTSYNYATISGTKNVLYGNHYGPRFYWRRLSSRLGFTPFGEALFGGSRQDTTVPATPGYPAYTTSNNCFSFKVGGGLDLHPSRIFEVRLIDVDYYRTSFGTNQNQSNYWVSTGIVIRLLRSKEVD
jgi:hypothetical protein